MQSYHTHTWHVCAYAPLVISQPPTFRSSAPPCADFELHFQCCYLNRSYTICVTYHVLLHGHSYLVISHEPLIPPGACCLHHRRSICSASHISCTTCHATCTVIHMVHSAGHAVYTVSPIRYTTNHIIRSIFYTMCSDIPDKCTGMSIKSTTNPIECTTKW